MNPITSTFWHLTKPIELNQLGDQVKRWKSKNFLHIFHQDESIPSILPIDFNVLVENIRELNVLAGETEMHFEKSDRHISTLKRPEPIQLTIYANGIFLFNGPFRSFSGEFCHIKISSWFSISSTNVIQLDLKKVVCFGFKWTISRSTEEIRKISWPYAEFKERVELYCAVSHLFYASFLFSDKKLENLKEMIMFSSMTLISKASNEHMRKWLMLLNWIETAHWSSSIFVKRTYWTRHLLHFFFWQRDVLYETPNKKLFWNKVPSFPSSAEIFTIWTTKLREDRCFFDLNLKSFVFTLRTFDSTIYSRCSRWFFSKRIAKTFSWWRSV